ncbi:NAD(P)-binding protein [Microbacterium elymi]|uniref:NAD(P)-binding protein n=1 Tax=Microbacterium elymi TaxID=2909587 RepID=A0ABY5NLX1_9MICO|nr:NAD(P)-binding protein [Microbacterium elymi]UUT36145.1 NAD(P)-binding protein [Microbacterium elymi]
MTVRRILIVGGGPAGLTAGLALTRAGFEVEIAELEDRLAAAGVGVLPRTRRCAPCTASA